MSTNLVRSDVAGQIKYTTKLSFRVLLLIYIKKDLMYNACYNELINVNKKRRGNKK